MRNARCAVEWSSRVQGSHRLYLIEKEMYQEGRLEPKYRRSRALGKEEFKARLTKDLGCRA